MSQLNIHTSYTLPNSSVRIPALGFGVYLSPPEVCKKSCITALEAVYRHIDTAQYYANEEQVGQSVKETGIPRENVFLTTKILSPVNNDVDETYKSLVESVDKIDKGGYVDLFLIHSPSSGSAGRKILWQALERLYKEGKTRAIGVSNCNIRAITELKEFAQVWPPHVSQIELHPWNQQREVVKFCQDNGIIVEAYCPLVRNQKADDPTLKSIAKKHNKETSHVLIRYCLQKGWVPLPKSDTPSRIESNANVYDFELTKEDMAALDDLDQGEKGAIVQVAAN